MRPDRSPHEIDRLRDEVRDLARENAELRALIQRPPAGGKPMEEREHAAGLEPRELQRRRRVLRRVAFNLLLLAAGVAAAVFSALRIDGWPVLDRNDRPAAAPATATPAPRAPAVPAIPSPPPRPAPAATPSPASGSASQ